MHRLKFYEFDKILFGCIIKIMKIIFDGEYTHLNDFLRKMSYNRFAGGAVKKAETERACWECKKQPLEKIKKYPVTISFDWYSKNKRADIDNIAFSKKFILDGMVMAGVLEDDSRKFVSGFSDKFHIDADNPRVEVEISSCA